MHHSLLENLADSATKRKLVVVILATTIKCKLPTNYSFYKFEYFIAKIEKCEICRKRMEMVLTKFFLSLTTYSNSIANIKIICV